MDEESQETRLNCGNQNGQNQNRTRHRSIQRMNSMKRQDSWTDFKGKAFKMASTVILPKHKRICTPSIVGGSMRSKAPSYSIKSLPQIKTFDETKIKSNKFLRSISAQEPSVTASDGPPSSDIWKGPVSHHRMVKFLPEQPCIDEERERSISESSSEVDTISCEKDFGGGGFRRLAKSRVAPLPKLFIASSTLPMGTDMEVDSPLFSDVKVDMDSDDLKDYKRRKPSLQFYQPEIWDLDSPKDTNEFKQGPLSDSEDDDDDGSLSYSDYYSCMPPPIFMLCITMIEIGFFIYHAKHLVNNPRYGYIGKYSPAPIDSTLIYSPTRRYELWRWLTYAMVHSGYLHLINNVVIQLVLGILLEMVHKFWRVFAIYVAGILAGSLATSIAEPFNYLAGASAGVYALIAAHLSTVILNWSEMERPWIRVFVFIAFLLHDGGTAIYFSYILGEKTNVGYAAHLGGAVAGLLVGSLALKNLKWEEWEKILWYSCIVICAFLLVFAILWNVVRTDLFP